MNDALTELREGLRRRAGDRLTSASRDPMPSLIDIRRRVRAVKSTQQITKAMKMVSASKLRRAQERIVNARPYAQKMLQRPQQPGRARRPVGAPAAGASARRPTDARC